jgi:Rps23 Pro-64 3,4-dihydroxylase Tpa1-like proline 4-hydroxylase
MARWLDRLPGFRQAAALRAAQVRIVDLDARVRSLEDSLASAKVERARLEQELSRRERQLARMKELQAPAVPAARLKSILKSSREAYQSAQPFPHIVIDDFVSVPLLEAVLEEFEALDRGGWHHTEKELERKWSTEDYEQLGPRSRLLIAQLNAGPFLTFLERLTGIPGIIADTHLRGGGLHEIRRGGLLGVHADFNFNQRLGLYRRLNLLVYLNRDWQEAWGGHLELWDRQRSACVQRIAPVFNRAVIFDTSNYSYHGHPEPLECPPDRSRRSVALYYYTIDYPYDQDRDARGTVFIAGSKPAAAPDGDE